ncbi:ABC transporter ATP-binding protein [Pseudomarimonas salicorniae]|uniref:ABC transporter ATP-binding protein n=1 Tax=Pseudomarimonas salicorniae TaxID=2933270 RepID=A0ABT0GDR2_9GAMM|nr:ABC transporter ATP-binding protein [Lysobacter sp. CAU 1642]MCK7592289.1 ABC transporter ATP-binding protein [Lysobacter sp. CAU 1642]
MTPLLSVRDAQVRYRHTDGLAARLRLRGRAWVEVVRGVSLEVHPRQTLAIVGESGSGKTSLAMALMGLVPMHQGEVAFDGQPIARGSDGCLRPDRRRIAMMFQDPAGSLSPRMTVGEALCEPFQIHGRGRGREGPDEALRLLDMVGLGADFAARYPHQLSGGQARRVGVARALALEPSLLIADEPTAGLDVSIQGDVLNLLTGLQERMGLGILIITHNLNIVRHVADRMAIMYLGKFVEQGDAADVFKQPQHPYTQALLSANPIPDPDADIERLPLQGEVPNLLRIPDGCEFHPRCPFAQADCRSQPPTTTTLDDGHRYRCHHPVERA